MSTIIIHWRERPEEDEGAYSKWTDVVRYQYTKEDILRFWTPCGEHRVNVRATQMIQHVGDDKQ